MTSVSDQDLSAHVSDLKGKVVLITGAAGGFGSETARQASKLGAKLVLSDLNLDGLKKIEQEIKSTGGEVVISGPSDVTVWADQLAVFKLAEKEFGQIDVVIVNAGITEIPGWGMDTLDENGDLKEPTHKTLIINLLSCSYTSKLALHYLSKPSSRSVTLTATSPLKSIVFLGSMASLYAIADGPMYTAAKHGIVGLAKSVTMLGERRGIRVSTVCPFFANTAIVTPPTKIFLAGVPKVSVPRVARTILGAATATPSKETNGSFFTLPDDDATLRVSLNDVTLNKGFNGLLERRGQKLLGAISKLQLWHQISADLTQATGIPILPIFLLFFLVSTGGIGMGLVRLWWYGMSGR